MATANNNNPASEPAEIEALQKEIGQYKAKIAQLTSASDSKDQVIKDLKALVLQHEETLKKLEMESVQKDEIIAEFEREISTHDQSTLEVPEFPTVRYNGEVWQVRAKRFRIPEEERVYEVTELTDSELVARLIASKAGFLHKVAVSK